jgi:hypothetical protein
MRTRISGVVQYVNANERMIRGSMVTMYNIKINGVAYSTRDKQPACEVGDTVSFDADTTDSNGKTYWNVTGPITVQSAQETAPKPQAKQGFTAGATKTGNNWMDDERKQRMIARQSSYNTAVQFLAACVAGGAVPLAKTKGQQAEVMENFMHRIANDLFASTLKVGGFDAPVVAGPPGAEKALAAAAADTDSEYDLADSVEG